MFPKKLPYLAAFKRHGLLPCYLYFSILTSSNTVVIEENV